MSKTAKGRIRKFIKEKFEYKVNPSGIFRAKITKELDYEPDSYKMNGSLKLKCKCGDVLYTPLDGILVYNPGQGIISIEHGHLFFDNKIRRVRTEYKNIKYMRMRENRGVDKIFECIRIKEGQSFAAVVDEETVIEIKLFIDNVSVDPEPFILESYF